MFVTKWHIFPILTCGQQESYSPSTKWQTVTWTGEFGQSSPELCWEVSLLLRHDDSLKLMNKLVFLCLPCTAAEAWFFHHVPLSRVCPFVVRPVVCPVPTWTHPQGEQVYYTHATATDHRRSLAVSFIVWNMFSLI